MDSQIAKLIIAKRFDVKTEKPWKKYVSDFYGSEDVWFKVTDWTNKQIQDLPQKLIDSDAGLAAIGLPEILHLLLLGYVLELDTTDIERPILEYVFKLRQDDNSFLPIPAVFMDQWKDQPASDVYSTVYGELILLLISGKEDLESAKTVVEWIKTHRQNDGLIYNPEWSDTNSQYRLQAEKTSQIFLAALLIEIIHECTGLEVDEDFFEKSISRIQNDWPTLRFMSARYYALKAINIIKPDVLKDICADNGLEQFLQERLDDNGGFLEYRLEDKFDEHARSAHRTRSDRNTPHVFSTYYGIWLSYLVKQVCGKPFPIKEDSMKKFLTESWVVEGGGFGKPVLVREYRKPYGPIATTLETLLVTLSPGLKDAFDN